jgi:UDP-glucose 4-epimerase
LKEVDDQKMINLRSQYNGRAVLITGGMGFIGSNLARRLVELGVEVIIVDALLPKQGGNPFNLDGIANRVKFVHADIGHDYVANHLIGGVDIIFNFAGHVSHLDSVLYPHEDLQQNCDAQLTLLEACRSYNPRVKIVFTSTRQVYGRPDRLPITEAHRVAPLDVNGIHKLAAEHYHLLYHRLYGIPSVCLRLTNTYGPRLLLAHKRQGVIGWFVRQALTGGIIELYGEGRQRRDINYIDDVIDALLLAGCSEKADGEIFNLGGNEPVSLAEIATELVTLTGRGSVVAVPFPPEQQLIEIGNCYLSSQKIQTMLGWRPRTSWRDGLARTVEFYRTHLPQYLEPPFDSVPRSTAAAL